MAAVTNGRGSRAQIRSNGAGNANEFPTLVPFECKYLIWPRTTRANANVALTPFHATNFADVATPRLPSLRRFIRPESSRVKMHGIRLSIRNETIGKFLGLPTRSRDIAPEPPSGGPGIRIDRRGAAQSTAALLFCPGRNMLMERSWRA